MAWLDVAIGGLRVLAFALVVVAVFLLYRAHRRSRATVFADLLLKATLLFMALLYLAFVDDAAAFLPGDPGIYKVAAAAGYVVVAAFFLFVAEGLWSYTKRTDGAIIVSPDFLVGLRTRTAAMYGDSPSRFIVYAVGKESAEKGMRRFLARGDADPARLWRQLPGWFRQMGYGHMRILEKDVGREVRLRVDDTLESLHPDKMQAGCDLTRAYLAGMGSALHPDKDCECVEARCSRLQGGGPCEFTLHWFPRSQEPRPTETPQAAQGI